MQFHPTAIAAGRDPMPLATEALRGEGARLIDEFGAPVMAGIKGGDLAPRDVVARGIFQALGRGRTVYLDTTGRLGERMPQRFPTVAALCAEARIDPAVQPIPVRPAAHYHMGGILVDEAGRSTVPGLWACGEVSSTGLHGANRLASNSLLEALAFAPRIAESIGDASVLAGADRPAPLPEIRPEDPAVLIATRGILERYVGVVRDEAGLSQAVAQLTDLSERGSDAAATGLMIARAALGRRESRGAHWRSDYPGQLPARHSVVTTAAADALVLQELTDA
ncbi:hypothetical protein GCM10025880_57430 [Methylorubrum aminovorans]|nr:hypothetical protein GCM10025880_57430 [Methylorubrum aminovorans]